MPQAMKAVQGTGLKQVPYLDVITFLLKQLNISISQILIFTVDMAKVYTTEITSEQIGSDNPIHQRLFKAYVIAKEFVRGDVLEVGCGTGRGVGLLMQQARSFTAVDKLQDQIAALQLKHPGGKFLSMNIPPLKALNDNAYDTIVSFQVIEHIQDDTLFLKEIHRLLKPGGVALITTPNRSLSLSRNPWHIREYLPKELKDLAEKIFPRVEMKGIAGNDKIMNYHEQNKRSVKRITQFDIFNLQYRLPSSLLKIPYEILNRWNRNKLQSDDNRLVTNIHHDDYLLVDDATGALDLFLIVWKDDSQ